MSRLIGGPSATKDATDEIQEVCNTVKGEVEGKVGRPLEEYSAKKYTSQVVAGVNYFVKVHIGGEDYIHLRIYKDLQQQVSLHSLQTEKASEDEIVYFQ